MDKIEAFFEKAKKVCLTETEVFACRNAIINEIRQKPVREATKECLTTYMSDVDPSLVKAAQDICLSQEESLRMEESLLSFMNKNPVNMGAAIAKKEPKQARMGFHELFFGRFSPMLAAVMILVLGGGSLSYAAEYALPGDTLYPVKIYVNEEVHGALVLSPEARASWATKRAERRIKEAKTLAAAGRLTPEASTTIITAFNTHIADAHTDIRLVAKSGHQDKADHLSKETETLLREQAASLPTDAAVAVVLENVQRATDKTIALDTSISGEIAMQESAASASTEASSENSVAGNVETSSVPSSVSASSRALIAVDLQKQGLFRKQEKKEHAKKDESNHSSLSAPLQAIQTMGILHMKQTSSSKTHSSFSSTGCGSSAISIKSTASSAISEVHISSVSSASVTVDIDSNGQVNVNIETPGKNILP